MTRPFVQDYLDALEATWPAAAVERVWPWHIRDGQGGGSRVSAATRCLTPVTIEDVRGAEAAMTALGQPHLFMIRQGDPAHGEWDDDLDDLLAGAGYAVKDPVALYAAPVADMVAELPPVTTFRVWPPLAAQVEIWAEGGIGPARLAVMERAEGPKVSLMGRISDAPAAAGFVACAGGIAMVHALETAARYRRQGLGRVMMQAAAVWAAEQGAAWLALCVTRANVAANALYQGMGMQEVAGYHYRIGPGA